MAATTGTDFHRLPRAERDRIAQARAEVGETSVTPAVARLLVAAFVAALALPHVSQLLASPGFYRELGGGRVALADRPLADGLPLASIRAANRALLARATAIEDGLADESVIGRRIRPIVQSAMTAWLGAGTAQVEIGDGGWLFYRPDLDHVTGPGFLEPRVLRRRAAAGDTLAAARAPDPRPALAAFQRQLAQRGIRLIVAPIPVKPSADPDRVGGSARFAAPVVPNRSWMAFLADLDAAGVTVFDAFTSLAELRVEGAGPLYLATDTHWRPATMQRVAADLARFIEASIMLAPRRDGHVTRAVDVTNDGDTARLLELGPRQARYPPETVATRRVETVSGEPWQPSRNAEVLLLGDSFTNVYALDALGWGVGAGLAEQLAVELERPVDRIAQNDQGALAPRRLFAAALAREPQRFAETRVVVYQFAARELSQGDWAIVDLPPAGPAPAPGTIGFWPPAAARATIEATVAAAGFVPRPGSVPYRDHVVAIHLNAIDVIDGPAEGAGLDAVVYVRSMIDNELTEAASWRPGDRVRLALQPWADVAPELDGINRGELSDPALLLVEPWWGVP
ncbi:MAG: hypothetical protein F4W89_08935 [Acidobacteria bacterium]|nr:hypothetical protein [Acidobacteriota bacterium]